MPHQRSDEADWWFDAVYRAIREVPVGKVTSYGHIARLLGEPQRSRQVGVCLKHLPSRPDPAAPTSGEPRPRFHEGNVPWQRIINSKGQISPRGPGSAARQANALRRERVEVTRNAMGEHCIDWSAHGWFPGVLPSEAGGDRAGNGDGEGDDTVEGGQDEGDSEAGEREGADEAPGEDGERGDEGEGEAGDRVSEYGDEYRNVGSEAVDEDGAESGRRAGTRGSRSSGARASARARQRNRTANGNGNRNIHI